MDEQRDEALIRDYYAGQEEAFTMLYNRHKRPVFNFALRMLGNRADAEDVTADVFVALSGKRYCIRPGAQLNTWLFTVARNQAVSRLRKRKGLLPLWSRNAEEEAYQPWEPVSAGELPPDEMSRREQARIVRRALTRLPDMQKQALILCTYHRFSYEQISEILGCSLANIKVLIYRAREHLRAVLPPAIREEESHE